MHSAVSNLFLAGCHGDNTDVYTAIQTETMEYSRTYDVSVCYNTSPNKKHNIHRIIIAGISYTTSYYTHMIFEIFIIICQTYPKQSSDDNKGANDDGGGGGGGGGMMCSDDIDGVTPYVILLTVFYYLPLLMFSTVAVLWIGQLIW